MNINPEHSPEFLVLASPEDAIGALKGKFAANGVKQFTENNALSFSFLLEFEACEAFVSVLFQEEASRILLLTTISEWDAGQRRELEKLSVGLNTRLPFAAAMVAEAKDGRPLLGLESYLHLADGACLEGQVERLAWSHMGTVVQLAPAIAAGLKPRFNASRVLASFDDN